MWRVTKASLAMLMRWPLDPHLRMGLVAKRADHVIRGVKALIQSRPGTVGQGTIFLCWQRRLSYWTPDSMAQGNKQRNWNDPQTRLSPCGWAVCHHDSSDGDNPCCSVAAFLWVEKTFVEVLSSGNDLEQVTLCFSFCIYKTASVHARIISPWRGDKIS